MDEFRWERTLGERVPLSPTTGPYKNIYLVHQSESLSLTSEERDDRLCRRQW